MGPVPGKPKEPTTFGRLDAVDVLAWYDGPRTFTLHDADGGLCLAHWLDEDREAVRFVVVPVSDALVARLQSGELTVRDVLDQPRVYVVDQENSGHVRAVWLTRLADLPQDALPVPGTTLHRPATAERAVSEMGLVRELDADKMTFQLRGSADDLGPRRVCRFDAGLWHTVHELLGSAVRVQVVGKQAAATGVIELTELSPISG